MASTCVFPVKNSSNQTKGICVRCLKVLHSKSYLKINNFFQSGRNDTLLIHLKSQSLFLIISVWKQIVNVYVELPVYNRNVNST